MQDIPELRLASEPAAAEGCYHLLSFVVNQDSGLSKAAVLGAAPGARRHRL